MNPTCPHCGSEEASVRTPGYFKCALCKRIHNPDPPAEESWEPSDDDAPDAPPPPKRLNGKAPAAPDFADAEHDGREPVKQKPALEPATDPWQTTADRLRVLAAGGPKIRTGIACIDAMLRGGIRTGRIVGIGGGPHCGKTTLCSQVSDNMSRDGVAVALIAYDEASDGIDSRLLQAHGCSREETEEPTELAFEVAEELAKWPLHILEPCNIEEAAAELARRYPDRERVLIVDSIQRARTARSAYINNPRERVDDVLETCKRLARSKETRCLVIFTSELSRGAYRNRDASDNIEDMAAGKESGAIEYHADVWMVMRWEAGEQGRVTVAIPKNRVGSRTRENALELQLDAVACRFLVLGEEAQAELRERAQAAAMKRSCQRVLEACQKEQGLNTRELKQAARVNNNIFPKALRILSTDGRLVNRGSERKAEWWAEVPA